MTAFPEGPATAYAEPHPDPLGLLAHCEQAALEREGIAMFVGLHDARPAPGCPRRTTAPTAADPEAGRLEALFDEYAAALAPGREERLPADDPTYAWSLIEVLVVLSEHHLRAPVGQPVGQPLAAP